MRMLHPIASTIRISRLVRAGLDTCLLLAVLGLFIQLRFLSDSHQANVDSKQVIAKVLNKAKTRTSDAIPVEHIEEFHDSEASMWASFFERQSKSNYASGSCRFISSNDQSSGQFHLLCSGENTQPSVAIKAEPIQVFVAEKAGRLSSNVDTPKSTTQEDSAAQPTVVRGWLDTPTGRKYFDPVSKRWNP